MPLPSPVLIGHEFSQKIKTVLPNLKTLYMSGYTADVIGHQGVLDHGVTFIQKPFSKKDPAQKVRTVPDNFFFDHKMGIMYLFKK